MKKTFLCLAVIWPAFGLAQETAIASQRLSNGDGIQLSLGVGVAGVSGVYAGQDDELIPFPLFAATYGPLTLDITKGLEFRLWENATTNVTAAVVYNSAPDLPDTALFADLDRDDWIGGELFITHDLGAFDIALSG